MSRAHAMLIWSPDAATLVRTVVEAGWQPLTIAPDGPSGAPAILVDARDDHAGAAAVLARAGAIAARVALVDRIEPARQDALIAAGATQIAVLGPDGSGLVQALRLARVAVAALDRRAPAVTAPSMLDRWIDDRLAAGQPVTVVHVAVRRLDLVNAAHGRDAGTALVAAAERRVATQIEAVAEEAGRVARVAGGGIVAAIAGPAADAVTAAARIEEALARPFRGEGTIAGHAYLGSRLALATARPGEGAAALLARAAAEAGEEAAPAGDDPLAVDIHLALARDEAVILYQPQAATVDGRVIGVEALARWRHPRDGLLGAEDLLAAADRAGVGGALSDSLHRRILAEVASWPPSLSAVRVALNLTAADLLRPGFVDTLLAHVDASGVARERLTLEVTETEMMGDLAAAAAVLQALQEAGCRTAIDDFGTGYSSLAYLAALPIDYLKLDRALVREAAGPDRGQVVVRAAIDMARSLGITVIAEGVETPAQRAALAAAGCALYQGFLLAPPLTGEELATLMEDA